jgi:tetratricopeptide (TPR) repeat protein
MAAALTLVCPARAAQTGEQPAGAAVQAEVSAQQTAAAGGVRVLPSGGLKMESAALLLSGQQGGTLPIAGYAMPLSVAVGERAPVAVVLEVDGDDLLAEHAGDVLYLEVSIYALGPTGGVDARVLQTLALDLELLRPELLAGGLKIVGRLDLAAGTHSLRVLLRNVGSDNLGVRILPLEVPAAEAGRTALLATLLADDPTAWLTVSLPGGAVPAWGTSGAPSARPLLPAGGQGTVRVLAAGLPAGTPLKLEVERPGGAEIGEAPADPVPIVEISREAAAFSGHEVLTFQMDASAVEQGEAELRVTTADGSSSTPVVRVVFADPSVAGRSWAPLVGASAAAGGAAARRAPATESPRGAERRERGADEAERLPTVAAFRAALAQLAAGEAAAAAEALVELESRQLVDRRMSVEKLREAEIEVMEDLAAVDRAALVPVLGAYVELYGRHARRQSTLLASHAREMVFTLAAMVTAEGATPEARQIAATALVALVAALPPSAARVVLSRALRQALVFDPGNVTAHLVLAVDAERNAEYGVALGHLEKIVEVDPGNDEARLRLAINRGRLGQRRAALDLLDELTAERGSAAPTGWWLALAYQELARIHVAEGDFGAAEGALRRGLERLPGEEKLSLQLAVVLAQRGQKAAGEAVVAAISPRPAGREVESARNRYVQLPVSGIGLAAAALRDGAEDRQGTLGDALVKTEGRRGR